VRIKYVDGFPVGDPEIVFKFRHPDENKAAAPTCDPGSPEHTASSSKLKRCL